MSQVITKRLSIQKLTAIKYLKQSFLNLLYILKENNYFFRPSTSYWKLLLKTEQFPIYSMFLYLHLNKTSHPSNARKSLSFLFLSSIIYENSYQMLITTSEILSWTTHFSIILREAKVYIHGPCVLPIIEKNQVHMHL